jgi:hypothetical protein
MIEYRVISGSLDKVGSIIEIPFADSNLGRGPVYAVDPKSRKCLKHLQRFEITAIQDGEISVKPVQSGQKESNGK